MSDNPNSILMTQAQYARHRNKSPQYIAKLAKAGVLVMRGRMMDAVASDAVLDDKPAERAAPDGQQPPTSYAQAKLADMVFRAKLRRLEFETRQGKLIDAALVKERWAAILVVLKERILAVPDKLALEVALTNERQVRDALKREMNALLKAVHSDIQYAR